MKRVLIFLLIAGQAVGAPRLSIGVVRAGSFPSAEAVRLVEVRLLRWLENNERVALRAYTIAGSVAVEGLRAERARNELRAELAGAAPAERDAVLARALEDPALYPSVQEALVARAAELFSREQLRDAEQALAAAAALHPDGEIASLWDVGGMAFEAAAHAAGKKLSRECTVDVAVDPPAAALVVNGFSFGPRRVFRVDGHAGYTFSAGGSTVSVQCGRASHRSIRIRGSGEASEAVAEVAKRSGNNSLALVQWQDGEFHLSLYTPGFPAQPIALTAPLNAEAVVRSGAEAALPIDPEAFAVQWEKQHLRLGLPVAVDESVRRMGQTPGPDSSKWYNNSTFWIVTGGVAASLAVAWALTRGGGSPETSRPSTVSVHLE